ncbi:hypothetical protein CBS101457_001937 [Exobasidium rhododendri]|nr:hypothetical protein CBS101457_001937 [Exobasidium rhododendri]
MGAAAVMTAYVSHRIPLNMEAPLDTKQQADNIRVDASTSQSFPIILPTPTTTLPTTCNELRLIGLGVRTVSFLRVKVYVAGLYVDSNALKRLENIEGWKGYEKDWMMKGHGEISGEKLVAALLDRGITCAIRIIPVRPTDFSHLRDGFVRAIQGRAKLARKQSHLSESSDEALAVSLQALKEAFPRTSLPKGQPLDLFFTPSSSGAGLDLTLEEGGKVLGIVESPRGSDESQYGVARQLMLAYLADKDEISKPFKESVALGFEQVIRG